MSNILARSSYNSIAGRVISEFAEFADIAKEGFTAAKNALSGLGTVEQGLSAQLTRLGSVEEGLEATKIANRASVSELRNIVDGNKAFSDSQWTELSGKYRTVDDKLIAQSELLTRFDSDLGTVHGDLQRTTKRIDDVEPKVANVVTDVADNKSKVAKLGGDMLDVFDRVSNIFNLLATLGTAARMEYIYNELKKSDDNINERISNLINMLSDQLSTLINGQSTLLERTLLLSAILNIVDILPSISNTVSASNNTINLVKNTVESFSYPISRIEILEDIAVQTRTEVRDIIPAIKPQVCLALAQCPSPALSSILDKISEIKSILGDGNLDCGNTFFAGNLSHGLEAIYCGLSSGGDIEIGNNNNSSTVDLSEVLSLLKQQLDNGAYNYEIVEDLEATALELKPIEPKLLANGQGLRGLNEGIKLLLDRLDNNQKVIFEAIQQQDTFAAIPEHWQVRVGADRPQLVISYGETLGDGKVGRSRYPLTIPHWNGNKSWTLLPRWRKGNIQARLILRDNSRVYLYAQSEYEAKRAMAAIIKFIDGGMIDKKIPFVGEANTDIKEILVEPCTAKFYEKGQSTEIPTFYQIRKRS